MKFSCTLLICFCFLKSYGQNSEPNPSTLLFTGVYTGLNGGTQNVFGGSYVNNMDILAQKSRFVTELIFGYRRQFLKGKLMAGLEFQLGFLDADLEYSDPAEPLRITYDCKNQSGIGITIGSSFGQKKNFALFGYLNETTRKFDVEVQQGSSRFSQKDEQGMLKFGIGTEYHVYKILNVRATFGSMNVDFGNQMTNIDVEDKYDFTFGIVIQL